MEGFVIRDAVPSDAAAISRLEAQTFTIPWSEHSVLTEIEKTNAVFLVCTCADELAGYVSMETVCGECYIGNLAVCEKHRRKGVGRAMLGVLKERAANELCDFITLEVRCSNTPARHLYESAGFTLQGIRPGFYTAPAEDAAIYTLFLTEDA